MFNRKEYFKDWYKKNKDRQLENVKRWKFQNKEKFKIILKKNKSKPETKEYQNNYTKNWRKNNMEKRKQTDKKRYEKQKKIVLDHYSNNTLRCNCCNEDNYQFLTVDHINGGGNKHRKEIGQLTLYKWLIDNNFPKGFQILCFNCNFGKRTSLECPHKSITRSILKIS